MRHGVQSIQEQIEENPLQFAHAAPNRRRLLGTGWARIVRTPSPFISTSGAGLAAVLNALNNAAATEPPASMPLGLVRLLSEYMWVKHPDSRAWTRIKEALAGLRDTVAGILADAAIWETADTAAAAVAEFVDAFNGSVRELNRAVSIVSGALGSNDFLEAAEGTIIESVRGPVMGPPETLDEAAETGVTVEPGAALAVNRVRLAATRPWEAYGSALARSSGQILSLLF